MIFRNIFGVSFLAILLTGCVVKQMVTGEYYLQTEKYADGARAFRQEILKAPRSPETNYYMGRFLLAEKKHADALKHLQKAVRYRPSNAEYHFWLGVAYGASGKPVLERKSYEKALSCNPRHLQSLIYLGHWHLEQKKYHSALTNYRKVLEIWPECPSALYNRGMIMRALNRTPEERQAWKEYLAHYPAGPMARRAVINLNRLGDFAYRNHIFGHRTVTLKKIRFNSFSPDISKTSFASLDLVGEILSNANTLSIHVIAYQKNNEKLAKARAQSIKKYLLARFSKVRSSQIQLSWFTAPEKITSGKKTFIEEESINIFSSP